MGVRWWAAGAVELIKVCLNGCSHVLVRGERYTVNDSGGGCITAGQQWRFWGVKNFRLEFIFDPCHVSLAPWNSKTGLGIKTGPFKYECADVYVHIHIYVLYIIIHIFVCVCIICARSVNYGIRYYIYGPVATTRKKKNFTTSTFL